MNEFLRLVALFSILNLASLQEIPDLVRVRKLEDAEGAEFVALDTIGLAEKWGYSAEQHNVTTSDGYILNIFRMTGSPNSANETEGKPIVFLMHGLPASSDSWLCYGQKRSLAMQLTDSGYDVWMGNFRGNTYGRNHTTLSPDDRKFWNFSYHEVGTIDLPNMIDYVLEITNQSKLFYVGHSMGTTMVFVMLSEKPKYNEKIELFTALAPVSAFRKKNELFTLAMSLVSVAKDMFEPDGDIELGPQSSVIAGFFKRICIPNGIVDFCLLINDLVAGRDREQLSMDELVEFFLYLPCGTSAKVFWHYIQGIDSGIFRQYDYGGEENIVRYGQRIPPRYNLKNVRTPMLIFYGNNDPISTKEEVNDLMENISAKSISERIKFKYFNHVDFIIAKDVKKLLNDRIIKRLSEFQNGEIPSLQLEDSSE